MKIFGKTKLWDALSSVLLYNVLLFYLLAKESSCKGSVGLEYINTVRRLDLNQTNSPLVPVLEPIFTQELILFLKNSVLA